MTARLLLAALASLAMTVFVTWPQALHMSTHLASHQDPEFSIWRLGWFAHAMATDPRHLFNANIFHPHQDTLAYSDAMLVEGAVAAPFFWLGLTPILIYNVLLLGAMAASGVAAFVLAHHLTGRSGPSLFAAAVFTMAPYRIEHFMHLELQWAMWVPLTFWALHLTLERRGRASVKWGLLAGVFLWLQIASSVYYGVFLAMAVAAFMVIAAITDWRRVVASLPGLSAGAVLSAALTAPYLWVYLNTAQSMGTRDITEIAVYSARLWSYFASPSQNLLWGWSSSTPEVNLFLGWNIMALALTGALLYREPKQRAIYVTVAATAIILSFGLNTPVYQWIVAIVPPLKGLRSPSRFGIISCCAVAVLAAFGADAVLQRTRESKARWAWAALPVLFLFVVLDYTNTGMYLMDLSASGEGTIYKAMKAAGPGVVVELPMPTAGTLPGYDTEYEMWSLKHWNPLVNGYSGYYPPDYLETLARMETFPDEDSIARLGRLDVRYVIVHCRFYITGKTPQTERDECPQFLAKIGGRRELKSYGKFTDPYGTAYLFVLNP
jgi:hypothetical protein